MARLNIPDETTTATFAVTTAEDEFSVSFALLDGKTNLRVTVDGDELTQSDFTFSGTLLEGGGYQGGTVTLNTPAENQTVVIWRDIAPARATNFAPAATVPVRTIDMALNRQMAISQDLDRRVGDAEDIGAAAGATAGATAGTTAAETVVATKLDTDGGNIGGDAAALRTALGGTASGIAIYTALTAQDARNAIFVPEIYTADMFASATVGAAAAYAAGKPFLHDSATDVSVPLDFSAAASDAERFAIWDAAQKWQASCILAGYGLIKLTIPTGLWGMGTDPIERRAGQPPLWIEAAAGAPVKQNITGLSIANVSGTLYEITVTTTPALPAHVVADFPIGMSWVQGNNDAQQFSGAAQVVAVAGDRLSFTYRQRFLDTVPTAPTTIDNTASSVSGLDQSQIVIPYAAFGWSGGTASIEAFINCYEGAGGYSRYMGWSWTGPDTTTNGAVIGPTRPGAWWYCVADDVFVGGPTKTIRASLGASFYANRSCFGGNDYAPAFTSINTQGGGLLVLVRCCVGGARTGAVSVGQATQYYLTQNTFVGNQFYAVEILGGASGLLYPALITHGVRGLDVTQGAHCLVTSATLVEQTTTYGIDWDDGSTIHGAPTFTGNAADAGGVANTLTSKGCWYKDTSALNFSGAAVAATGEVSGGTAVFGAANISASTPVLTFTDSDIAYTASISGATGHLYVRSYDTTRDVYVGTEASPTIFQFDTSASTLITPNLTVSTNATVGGTLGVTGALTGTSGAFSGAVSGTTGTFSAGVSGTTGAFTGAVSGTTGTFSGAVSGTTGTFTGAISAAGGSFTVNPSISNASPAMTLVDGATTATLDGAGGDAALRAHSTARECVLGYPSVNKWTFANSTAIDPPTNSTVSFALASDTSLVIKARGSDGVIRSVTLTLA